MPGILFLLDELSHARVERLWDQMEREFAIAKGDPGALPHFTVHLAGAYDLEPTRAIVEDVARTRAPFIVPTTGFGVFTGERPILYMPVVRTRVLDDIHAHLYRSLTGHCSEPEPYYAPERWMPHITVGQTDPTPEVLPALLAWLAHQPLSWEVHAAALAIGGETESSVELLGTYPLRG